MGDETGVAVMILNKSKTDSFNYQLSLSSKNKQGKKLFISVNAGIGKNIKSRIEAYSTQMLVFNPSGKLIKKYVYSSKDADNKVKPHQEK